MQLLALLAFVTVVGSYSTGINDYGDNSWTISGVYSEYPNTNKALFFLILPSSVNEDNSQVDNMVVTKFPNGVDSSGRQQNIGYRTRVYFGGYLEIDTFAEVDLGGGAFQVSFPQENHTTTVLGSLGCDAFVINYNELDDGTYASVCVVSYNQQAVLTPECLASVSVVLRENDIPPARYYELPRQLPYLVVLNRVDSESLQPTGGENYRNTGIIL